MKKEEKEKSASMNLDVKMKTLLLVINRSLWAWEMRMCHHVLTVPTSKPLLLVLTEFTKFSHFFDSGIFFSCNQMFYFKSYLRLFILEM